ncbi:MAG: NADH-quinone oxidoreductase subunit H, partial [Anaerolineae bacterium]
VSSLVLTDILIAGWSSNKNYSVLGAFRAVEIMVSYVLPLFLGLMIPVMLTGTMSMQAIVDSQLIAYFFVMPVAGLIFWTAMIAEVGRQPFDVLEAESEIVAGYNIEYSGFAFAIFYAAEWAHGFTICALMAVLYFAGWRGPFVETIPTLGIVYLGVKVLVIYFIQVWARFTVPRLRLDHIMNLCWKFLVPVMLVLLVVSIVIVKAAAALIPNYLAYLNPDLPYFQRLTGMLPRAGVLLFINVIVGAGALLAVSRQGRAERERSEALRLAEIEPAGPMAPIEPGAD